MRQIHLAGEKLFVDYCGPTVPVIDVAQNTVRQANIFVAVLGASNYTFAEATWSQQLPDWIGSHVRAFEFFCGAPQLVVYDYVPRNIIVFMCPPGLCGRAGTSGLNADFHRGKSIKISQ